MSNRIVHISVQLFSNEDLARHVTEECQLLDIMVTVLLYMMESCLIKSELQGELCLNDHTDDCFTDFVNLNCFPQYQASLCSVTLFFSPCYFQMKRTAATLWSIAARLC